MGLLHRPYMEIVALETIVQSTTSRIQFFYFLATEATRRFAKDYPANKLIFESMEKCVDKIYEDLFQANSDRNNLLHNPWTGIGVTKELSFSKDRFSAGKGELVDLAVRGVTLKLLADEAKYLSR